MVEAIIGPTDATEEIRAVAITAVFGSFTSGGTSGPLGNDTDSQVVAALREWADAILVGAGTVKAEDYGPANTPIAVVSHSLDLDISAKLFSGTPPLILSPESSISDAALEERRRALEKAGCEVLSIGGGSAQEITATLRQRGYGRIICEGGPSLYANMLSASLIDVLHLTIAPLINTEITGLDGEFSQQLELEHVELDGSYLFARYRRVAAS